MSEAALRHVPAWGHNFSDDALMGLARDGQHSAFEVLVRRYQPRLLRSAQRYMGDSTLAQEVAQRTVVELYQYVNRYEGNGKFERLLWRILINQCRLLWRQRDADARAHGALNAQPTAAAPTPLGQIMAAQDNERLQRAMASLSEKLRAAVVLRFVNDMSYEEVAAVLDIPVGTVKSRIATGIVKLKTLMEEEER